MINPLDLAGRRILITGASSGIGRETAVLFSELNARLVIAGRDPSRLEATLACLRGVGHSAEVFDLAALDDIPRRIKGIVAAGGPLYGMVHSAGLHAVVPIQALSPRRLEELMRVNVSAALLLAKAFRQQVPAAGGGSIVLLSSVTGLVGEPGISAYAATKAALIGATRSLALEFARERVRVNAIAPGVVNTEMTQRFWGELSQEQCAGIEAQHPLGVGTARDVAYGAAYLMADTGRWITGTTLVVDGGYTAR